MRWGEKIKTNTEKISVAIDTVESMALEDVKKLAIEKILFDINKREQREIAKNKGTNKEPQYHFTKVYKIPVRRLILENKLTEAEKAFLFDIVGFINRETNMIVDERGFPMGQEKLVDLCGWRRQKLSRVINGLIEKQIIFPEIEKKKIYYRVNEEFMECMKKK